MRSNNSEFRIPHSELFFRPSGEKVPSLLPPACVSIASFYNSEFRIPNSELNIVPHSEFRIEIHLFPNYFFEKKRPTERRRRKMLMNLNFFIPLRCEKVRNQTHFISSQRSALADGTCSGLISYSLPPEPQTPLDDLLSQTLKPNHQQTAILLYLSQKSHTQPDNTNSTYFTMISIFLKPIFSIFSKVSSTPSPTCLA